MSLYLKITQSDIIYPYTITELKSENYNTSFPSLITDLLLESFNVFPVIETTKPEINTQTEIAEETIPQLIDDVWKQTWTIRSLTPEELLDKIPKSITSLQGMLAINVAGLTAQFLLWKSALDPLLDFRTIIFLEKAQTWEYDNDIINEALIALNIVEQKQNLFALASTL